MEKQRIKLVIADYYMSPGPRYSNQGEDSGEEFYHKYLNLKFYESFIANSILEVNLDGPNGYASSFLDEAFGNLVFDFGLSNVNNRINIISNEEPEWIDMIKNETYIEWEERRMQDKKPKKTISHSPWYKLVNNTPVLKNWIEL